MTIKFYVFCYTQTHTYTNLFNSKLIYMYSELHHTIVFLSINIQYPYV